MRNNVPLTGGYGYTTQGNASTQLQSTISSATSGVGELPPGVHHHPISCATTTLRYEEDESFSCEHFEVPPGDHRTKASVNHSIALLIIEKAFEFTDMKELPYDRYESVKEGF